LIFSPRDVEKNHSAFSERLLIEVRHLAHGRRSLSGEKWDFVFPGEFSDQSFVLFASPGRS
jgi:hypothetical protein